MNYALGMTEEHRPDSVGLRIARLMKERGFKPKDLEGPSGLDRGTIFKLIRGERTSTSFEAGLRIARFLGVDPFTLLPGEGSGPVDPPDDVHTGVGTGLHSSELPAALHRWLQEAEEWMEENRRLITENRHIALEALETARSVKQPKSRPGKKAS